MHRVGRNTFSSFERVQEFLAQHPFADAPETLGAQATELDDVIARVSSDAMNQDAGDRFARAHPKSQQSTRVTFRHLTPCVPRGSVDLELG